MKRLFIPIAMVAMTLNGCGTYTGNGAYAGSNIGAILGSAIGGLTGGYRGSDIGTIVGMAGGAVVGAAIGSQADKKASDEVHEHYERVQERKAQQQDYDYNYSNDESGFDANNGGDDRLYDFSGSDYTGNYTAVAPTTSTPMSSSVDDLVAAFNYNTQVEIVNARFVDDNQDGKLSKGEMGKVIFEIVNRSGKPVIDVQPTVIEADGNKNIYISPSIHVERINPGQGIRYTAMVKATRKLRDGSARFCLSVMHGDRNISKITEFVVPTTKERK